MPAKQPKKPKRQSHLKAKEITPRVRQADLLKSASDMVSAQSTSPVGAQLAAEAGDVKAGIDAVSAANTAESKASAAYVAAHGATLDAEDDLADRMNTYARKAVKVCDDDAELLKTTAVVSNPSTRSAKDTGPAEMVTGILVLPGDESGSARVKYKRPGNAAAFIIQYQIEPASPLPAGSPPADWLPADGFHTKNVEWVIVGLPAGATIRVRVRAIGAQLGPWGDEVLGKAR